MKISFIEVQNFRKLKSCRVDFDNKQTILVGANNSGKTSAMDAIILFLKDRAKFSTRDITISNWADINVIGKSWLEMDENLQPDLTMEKWNALLPLIDVWLQVEENEIHYISHLIPTLDWQGGYLGVRLRLEPKNIETLYKDFLNAFNSSKEAKDKAKKSNEEQFTLKLWPSSMWDFLEKRLHNHFEIKAYILDPKKLKDPEEGIALPQTILNDGLQLDGDPFKGLIKVDIIYAQRGFTDPNAPESTLGNLSSQLKEYFTKHLNPSEHPEPSDIEALQAIEDAKTSFDSKLKVSFQSSLIELESLNYPGFGNPRITISSLVNPIDGLNHSSAVQFDVFNKNDKKEDSTYRLPEKYNGLGYQNLISMVFKLIRFRDEWMQVGKISKINASLNNDPIYEPLHLVLIEEPEAHLHAQVQQVFIRKAYDVLRHHDNLIDKKEFSTQLVVSTHSNHIAHEVDFTCLRYFKRKTSDSSGVVPTSTVVNLSKTFGTENETTKFAIRYLKTTHCDLFFADAVILVEGPAERILVPHFIRNYFPKLSSCYISLLEIGGSHAHRLKPLIEDLGLITLIITDLDSINPKDSSAIFPEKEKGYVTGNDTLKSWLPLKVGLDDLLSLNSEAKESSVFPIRVAYQFPFSVSIQDGKEEETIPYTFEDALAFENLDLFKEINGKGMLGKFVKSFKKTNAREIGLELFDALRSGRKAEFALDLLFISEPHKIKVPRYIREGLEWLQSKFDLKQDSISK